MKGEREERREERKKGEVGVCIPKSKRNSA
jgi:hypothetical protein